MTAKKKPVKKKAAKKKVPAKTRKPGQPEKLTKARVAEALVKTGAIRSAAAALLKVSCSTITNYIQRYPELSEVEYEAKTNLVGLAETKLVQKINEGHLTAIIFYLKTHDKDNYSERTEMTGGNGQPVQIQIMKEEAGL